MKKKIIFITTLLVIVATAVAVVSCKKERHDQNANGSEQTVQTAEKGGETISLEQAERDLGNLLNFDFGDANYATDVFLYDTLHAKLTLTDGQVDLSQLAVTYNTLLNEIIETYHQTDLPEKSVYAIQCQFNDTESKNDDIKDVEIVLSTRGYLGNIFGDTNDWRPNDRGGTCDGQYIGGYGAPEIIASWLNYGMIVHVGCENGGRLYYTDYGTSLRYGRDTYNSSTGGYDIYYSLAHYSTVCLTHETMMDYCNNIWSYWINRNFDPVPPANREPMSFEIHYGPAYAYSPYSMWTVTVQYAKPNCTGTEPVI